jgi:CubicO group peptidase (beta-lactamase class C family)
VSRSAATDHEEDALVDLRCPCPSNPLAGRLSRRAALRAAGLAAASLAAGGARIPTAAQDATPAGTTRASVLPDLTGVAPLPLTDERRAQFEAYVADALLRFGVPGASIAVVQNGDVVYLNGFGVRAAGSTQAVDPDTMLMIGSVTKSMTTMLAATLVDDGRLTWETRLIDILPAFAVGDPVLTESLSVRDAFCNCIGIPGRDIDLFFDGDSFTPEGVVTALADVAPTAARGERFQYNNLLIGAGGYAVGVAAEGSRTACCGLTTSRCGSGSWDRLA